MCLLAVVAALVGVAPSLASAQATAYVVSTTTDAELSGPSTRVGAAARAALRGLGNVGWRAPDRTYLGYDSEVADRLVSAADGLATGRQAYLELRLEDAIDVLGRAVSDYEAAAGALEDPSPVADALLLLGAAETFANRPLAARATFARVHTQMPQVHLDPNVFNPQVVAAFDAARPSDSANPTSSLSIDSGEAGDIVYVDFVARGTTPLDVGGLVGGEHFVRVTRPGAPPMLRTVRVRAGSNASVNAPDGGNRYFGSAT